jgi:nucleoside-diphosphate-sugar epimerase
MRVLVTGATGFLGGAVARRLHAQGHDVLATGRDLLRGERLSASGLTFRAADLGDRMQVRDLTVSCDWVVHCAALSSPWGPTQSFVRANVVSTGHLVDAALAARVGRFVHISTPSIYMGQGSRLGVCEDDPLPPPVNDYARTKLHAERIVTAAKSKGLASIILRPRALFGPGDTTIFPRLLRALQRGRLPVIGDGQNMVDLTYIDNAVDAVELACQAGPEAVHSVCNISNGEPVKLWSVIATLAAALGLHAPSRKVSRRTAMALAGAAEAWARAARAKQEPTLTRYGVSVLADSMTLDLSRARTLLGYRPQVSIDEGLARFVQSQKESR